MLATGDKGIRTTSLQFVLTCFYQLSFITKVNVWECFYFQWGVDNTLLQLEDRKPIEPVPPTFDEELEKAAEAEFDKLFPNADTDMDVHAAQLKARHVVFILMH